MSQKISEAPVWSPPAVQEQTLELGLRTITPLFGGGFEPREVDTILPVRPAAIRGHLRFWWRAVAGSRFADSKALFAAEESLWGSASKLGRVVLQVSRVQCDEPQPCAEYKRNREGRFHAIPDFDDLPGYALFPFKGKAKADTIEEYPSKILRKIEFSMKIMVDGSGFEEVCNAVAAWIRYGGIGGRTRRGCGSIALNETHELRLPKQIRADTKFPLLSGSRYILGKEYNNPIEAWQQAVNLYRDFRQKPGFARNEGQDGRRPGRSLWPEPDAIRKLTQRHDRVHPPIHPVDLGFPRADLGLPIVFQFKDQGDPDTVTLQGSNNGAGRMASPVITKALANGNGKYQPLILVMNAPHSWEEGDLTLISGGAKYPVGKSEIELTHAERQQIFPLKGSSPRDALLEYASNIWRTTVEELS